MTENLAEDKQQLKVRIFALAKELGMDSKVLIQHCNDAGIPVKASALASISPAERDVVLDYINAKSSKPAKADAPVLPRELPVEVAGKARAIKTIPTAPRAMAPVVRPLTPPKSVPDPELPPPEPEPVAQPVQEVHAEAVEAAAMPEEAVSKTEADVGPVSGGPVEDVGTSAPVEDDDSTVAGAHRREDYIAPHGISPSKLREMRPIGSTGDMRPTGTVRKSKPNLPQLAAIPDAPVVKVKKDDRPAQKPDIKITADFDHTGPLAGRVSQVVEGKKSPAPPRKRMMTNEEEEAERTKGKGPGGGPAVGSREERRQKRHTRVEIPTDDDDDRPTRTRVRMRRPKTVTYGEHKTHAEVDLPISLRSLSEAMGRPVKALMGILFKQNKMVGINDVIEEDLALELAMELGVELSILREKDLEEELMETLKVVDSPESLVTRPPIVTILGHVDHGKTTLLDKIRSSNVAGGEAGGITQHIRAYQIEHSGHKVTFVDTPGHAAFGQMRARGANVTDVIVLVVAANDGVMPQTIECIAHAKASGATVVVAMNKIDLPDRNEQKLLSDLATHGLLVQEWGGDIEMVRTSGISGAGIPELLELLQLTAEVQELKANPNRPAVGLCLEGFRDEGRGVLALMMVRQGTLRVGDIILCGGAHGRIRALYNDLDQEVAEAPPSTPVRVAGLDIMPNAGEQFFVMDDLDAAREIAEIRQQRGRSTTLSGRTRKRTLDDILNSDVENAIKDLPLIIKADTPGSIEAIKHELAKFDHPEVRVNLLHAAVGGVNESDIYLASASGAIIVAFHVTPDDRAVTLADKEGVDIRKYQIIYEVTDEIKVALEGLLTPEKRQVSTGRAIVLQTFSISRTGTIAGCRVLSGNIERNSRIRLIRDQKVLNDYAIASLKRVKDDAREVREGMECGIRLDHFNDIKEGDLLEAYRIEEVKRKME